MNKIFFSAVVLCSSAALAADAAQGSSLYHDNCASCHSADRNAPAKSDKGPDLMQLMKTKESAELNAWILQPGKRNKDTACDTGPIAKNPDVLPNLWAFLQGRIDAPPLPKQERRKAELTPGEVAKWKTRKRGEQ